MNIIVEDVVSEAVMSRLLSHVGYIGATTYRITHGNVQLRKNVPKYKGASRVVPHIVLTDLDRYQCPPDLLKNWEVGELPHTMLLRIAIREVEAWLLSDRKGIAAYLQTATEKLPLSPEAEDDPKKTLFSVVRKSRKKRLIEEIVPQPGAHIGPLYNDHMCNFVINHWRIEPAMENSPSLLRSIRRISEFLRA